VGIAVTTPAHGSSQLEPRGRLVAFVFLIEVGCASFAHRDESSARTTPGPGPQRKDLGGKVQLEPARPRGESASEPGDRASVAKVESRPEASGVPALAAMLILGGLAGRLWFEHRRRQAAEVEARSHLATMAHLDRIGSIGELTASLTHELHQPLGAILRNSEAAALLLASGNPNLEELREIVEDIRKEDKRATEIIRRMRALLRKEDLREEQVDLNEVARETVELISPEAASRGVRVDVEVQSGSATVAGDRVHLQQALLNLVLNAMDAMRDTPSEHRRLVVAVAATNGRADVSVRDFGSGIPAADMQQMFEPFYTTKKDGLGVGLSIVRSIIEAHNGSIGAENNADRGATVRFALPLHYHG
jgi:signal transduction histidine kinase